MKHFYITIPLIIILAVILLFIIIFHFKKKAVIKKVKSLSSQMKQEILNEIVKPFGYDYKACGDIFSTRLNAPQKLFGYTTLYDLSAPYFNMVFDYETVYFDYSGKTWLIEMWKGQYGINTGCELGIYYADRILSPKEYDVTLFKAVEDFKDMPEISLKLNRKSNGSCYSRIGLQRRKHWWLTMFKVGLFSKPEELFVNTSIKFNDFNMLQSFVRGFSSALPGVPYKISGLSVYFTFSKSSRKYSFFKKAVRHIALSSCKAYCKLFNFVTRPFSSSGDRILYLYYYLPPVARHILRK